MEGHATWPDDPGLMGIEEDEATAERNARISLELQLMRIGFDLDMEVNAE